MFFSSGPEGPVDWDLVARSEGQAEIGRTETEPFAVPLDDSEEPGYGPVFVNSVRPNIEVKETMYEVAKAAMEQFVDRPCLGWRNWNWSSGDFETEYKWITYGQLAELRTAIGSALTQLLETGTLDSPKQDSSLCTAFWAPNRPEFQQLNHACQAYSFRIVALYDASDIEAASFIMNHAQAQVLLTTYHHAARVVQHKAQGHLPQLKLVVVIDAHSPPTDVQDPKSPPGHDAQTLQTVWSTTAIAVMRMEELVHLGRLHPKPHVPPTLDHVAQLVYTSGTTGKPKAAMITHRTLSFAIQSVPTLIRCDFSTMLGWLPVAHSFACMIETVGMSFGGKVGYSCGDTRKLLDDLQILKPDVFPTVPRVLNRIAAKLEERLREYSWTGMILRRAVQSKLDAYDRTGAFTSVVWDNLLFNRFRALMGGKVHLIITGSAPVAPHILRLLRVALACPVVEGYGLTETFGIGSVSMWTDKSTGPIGPPQAGVHFRLKDNTELGYSVNNSPPSGELLIRGGCVFDGYLGAPEQSAEMIDDQGWLHTGDIAAVDDRGRFSIVDRIKNLVKLSQGEYVAIEKLESVYAEWAIWSQFVVYGDSLQHYLVAVGSIEPKAFTEFVQSKGLYEPDAQGHINLEAACKDPRVKKVIAQELQARGRKAGLTGVEMVKNVRLYPHALPNETELMTPTFKVKRNVFAKLFKQDLNAMYDEGPIAAK